jgi:hypothetical protein
MVAADPRDSVRMPDGRFDLVFRIGAHGNSFVSGRKKFACATLEAALLRKV